VVLATVLIVLVGIADVHPVDRAPSPMTPGHYWMSSWFWVGVSQVGVPSAGKSAAKATPRPWT